jgi:hypothetical protein
MENQPIIFGRDITTNAITQIRTIGNTLFTTAGGINDLDDVDISGVVQFNSFLRWSAGPNAKWVNVNPHYFSFVMYGTLAAGNFSVTTDRQIITSSSSFWAGTPLPNPGLGVGGFTSGLNVPYGYNATTGIITIDPNRRYMCVATYNESGANIDTPTNFELALVNWTTGSVENFPTGHTGGARTLFTQRTDFSGVSACVSYVFFNISAFSLVLRTVTAQSVSIAGTDCNININLWEI